MCNRLYYHLQCNNILYEHQFGFRHNYSTTLALVEVIDNIMQHLDNGETVLGIFFDLQKAFDTVNHEVLLHKLYHYGVRGIVHQWFESYLSDRYQYTFVNNKSSPLAKVTCGVPQGSVLGPLLFLIYVNDIANSVIDHNLRIFADDTNLFIAGDSIRSVNRDAQLAIDSLYNWFVANKLTVNVDKTCYMVFPRSNTSDINLFLNGLLIKKVDNCRYLGVIIDDELSWREHIQSVYNKLIKYTSIFYKLRQMLPSKILRDVYFALVHSHLMYAIEIYANTSPTYLHKLSVLNNKLLRILQYKSRRASVLDLYSDYNTLPVHELHLQQILLFVFRVVKPPHRIPSVFKNYFDLNKNVHEHNTRLRSDIHLHRTNSKYGQKCLKFKGACLWNKLPEQIKMQTDSASAFKTRLRQFLINQRK